MSPMIEIVCPSCGFTGHAPPSRIPARSVKLSCNQCKEQFPFDGAAAHATLQATVVTPSSTPASSAGAAESIGQIPLSGQTTLSGFGELMSESWGVFKDRFWRLIGLYLLGILPFVLIGIGAAILVPSLMAASGGEPPSMGLVVPLVLIAATVATLALGWMMAAVHCVIVDGDLTFGGAMKRGWELVWSFLWLYTLLGFIVGGASMLLLVPGIIFAIFFLFSGYILAAEGDRGMTALLKSRAYLRGYGLPVFVNLLIFFVLYMLASFILAFIPFVGQLLSMVLGIFTLVFYYVIYMDLRGIKGSVKPEPSGSTYLLVGLVGFLLAITLPFMMGGFGM